MPLKWRFDPVPPSGAIEGGIPVSYVFSAALKTFVREVLQNSHDQRAGIEPVLVEFDLITLGGPDLVNFLEALRWQDLESHLSASTQTQALTSRSITECIEAIDGGQLTLLRVADYNTNGLVGEEDTDGKNFKALVRNVLDTTEEKKSRGGSHGLGKAVLWTFSAASTVLFSSVVRQGSNEDLRLIGRTVLPHHITADGAKWAGSGWLGTVDPNLPARSISSWNDWAIAKSLFLNRNKGKGTGTSILIVGFHEPEADRAAEPEALLRQIEKEAALNFWPAIAAGTLRIRLSHRNGTSTQASFEVDAKSEQVEAFTRALEQSEATAKAVNPGDLAEALIELRVPAKRSPSDQEPHGVVIGSTQLRMLRSEADHATHELRNRVALIRGAGMVVKYWKPPREPLSGGGFFGVLKTGHALGSTEQDTSVEQFLRASEPPAHNDWIGTTIRVRNEYTPGGRARLSDLFKEVNAKILELCEDAVPPDSDGPDLLKRMFTIKTGTTEAPSQAFSTTYHSAQLKDGMWIAEASTMRSKGEGPWTAKVRILLDGESGSGEALSIVQLEPEDADDVVIDTSHDQLSLRIPDSRDKLRFKIVALPPSDAALASRTRIRVVIDNSTEKPAAPKTSDSQ